MELRPPVTRFPPHPKNRPSLSWGGCIVQVTRIDAVGYRSDGLT